MDKFDKELSKIISTELRKKEGGSLSSIVGRLVGKISPMIMKNLPKILPTLGLAAVSGAITGSTERATRGGSGKYKQYGLSLTESQKNRLGKARDGITLRLSKDQLSGNDALLLTSTQVAKIERSKRKGVGLDLKLSKTQLSKQGGFGPIAGSLLAGIAAPMIAKLFGFGKKGGAPGNWRPIDPYPDKKQQRDELEQNLKNMFNKKKARGLRLPGTRQARGLRMPGT